MKKIETLSDMIEEEICDAEKYAKQALDNKEKDPVTAELFFKLANEEVNHANLLHARVVAIIEDYQKKNGDPPEGMMMLYEILHRRQVANMAAVKGMLILYK